ncbi:MAG: condensation domain-containing protein, partial [Bacteroidota bacterium]
LRARFDGEDSFRDLLDAVKKITLEAYTHQSYPFDKLVDALKIQRDRSRNPLFDVVVVLQNNEIYDFGRQQATSPLNIHSYDGKEPVVSKFDLIFTFEESAGELQAKIEFNTAIYSRDSINRLTSHLRQLLEVILRHPSKPIRELKYLTEKEERQLLVEFNDTTVEYPNSSTIGELFTQQAKKTPDRIAVVFEEVALTYKELDQRSGQLARHLHSDYNIQPEDRIGVMLDRSEKMIIAILAILKSGGAYVPIDPHYPTGRKEFITRDAGTRLLITQTDYLFELENYQGSVFAIDVQSDFTDS